MNDKYILSLITGAAIGAVIAVKYKPARDMVQDGVKAVEQQVKTMKKQ